MKQRVTPVILLTLIAVLVVALPVLAYTYRASYVVSENGTASYDMLPVLVGANNQWMADNGFMSASANDTRIETLGGLQKPHLVADNMTLTAIPVPANSQTNLYFTTGNTPDAQMSIITGYGGSFSRADAGAGNMELGSSFEIELDGYVDTTAGSNKNLVYKQDAFRTYVSSTVSGNITASTAVTFPTIGSTSTGASLSMVLPTGFAGGDLIVASVSVRASGGPPTITGPSGWVQLYHRTGSEYATNGAWYRIISGDSSPAVFTASQSDWGTSTVAYRFSEETYITVPVAATPVTSTGSNPNPPALTTGWGAVYTMYIAFANSFATQASYPANYNNNTLLSDGGEGRRLYAGTRNLVAASDDPGTFGTSTSHWIAGTVAVRGTVASASVTATGVSSADMTVVVRNNAQEDIYDESNANNLINGTNQWHGQTFTPTEAYNIGAVRLYGYKSGNPGDMTISIRATSSGLPTGGDLASGVILQANLPSGSPSYATANLTSVIELALGTQYAIVWRLSTPDGAGNNWRSYIDDTSPTYTGGTSAISTNAGSSWGSFPSWDFRFATYTGFEIVIDGDPKAGAVVAPSVADNSNAWVFAQNNVMPYVSYYSHTVNNVEVARYEPSSMIIGTTLPNELNPGTYDATISWGANPIGVAVSLGGLVSSSQPVPGQGAETPTQDILPEVEVSDWFVEPDVSGVLLTSPLRPLVTILSDTTTLTELQAWRLLGLAFVLLVTVSTARVVRGHHVITGSMAGASILAAVVMTVFPMWALVFVAFAVVGGLVAERSPSL